MQDACLPSLWAAWACACKDHATGGGPPHCQPRAGKVWSSVDYGLESLHTFVYVGLSPKMESNGFKARVVVWKLLASYGCGSGPAV